LWKFRKKYRKKKRKKTEEKPIREEIFLNNWEEKLEEDFTFSDCRDQCTFKLPLTCIISCN